jgi:acyl-CoA thioester hydrolase
MKPKPFKPKPFDAQDIFFRDATTGKVWHRCSLRTLYIDTDRSGVVYHSNYLRYFEFGRASLMRDAGYPYSLVEESGYVYPIIEVGLQYHAPLYYDDPMHIYTMPGDLERVKLQFDYAITNSDSGSLVCTGFTRHCALNQKGIPIAIDGKTVELWKNFPK